MHVARALRDVGDVEIIVVDGEGKGAEWSSRPEKEFKVAGAVSVSPRPNNSLAKKVQWALNPRTYYPHGCGVDDEAMKQVLRTAQECDLIWFCKLRTPNMFPRWAWDRSVADIDDVPSTFEKSVWHSERRVTQRLAAARRFLSWRRRDRLLGDRFTVLSVCSDADKRYLRSIGIKSPLYVIPNGFDRPKEELPRRPAIPPRLGFIGIFDYEPNLEGIRWFARYCWPLIKVAVPEARLRLVGRHSNGPLKPSGRDIDGLGWVEEAAEEIATWSAMVVPIQQGAGSRGKIAHAFSLKCPIVSTTLGAHGYECVSGREMYISDSAEAFANACVRAIREPAEAAAMAERGWQQFLNKWTWEAIAPSVCQAAEDCLRRSSGDIKSNGSLFVDDRG